MTDLTDKDISAFLNLPNCGLNASWNVSAWQLTEGPLNGVNGAYYILDNEAGQFELVMRFFRSDNDNINLVATAPFSEAGLQELLDTFAEELANEDQNNPLARFEDDEPPFAAYPVTDDLNPEGLPLDGLPTLADIAIGVIASHSVHLGACCRLALDMHAAEILDVILEADNVIHERAMRFERPIEGESPLPATVRRHVEGLRTYIDAQITLHYAS